MCQQFKLREICPKFPCILSTEMSRGKRTVFTWERSPHAKGHATHTGKWEGTVTNMRWTPTISSSSKTKSEMARAYLFIYIFNTSSIYLICTCFKNTA